MADTQAQWKDLAMRAIDCLRDVERETDWGQPTFGPSVWERLRDEQNELLNARAPDLQVVNERLREALRDFLGNPQFQVAVGGNPNAVDAMLGRARAALSEQEGR